MKKSDKNVDNKNSSNENKKYRYFIIVVLILFLLLVIRIGYLQSIKSSYLKEILRHINIYIFK